MPVILSMDPGTANYAASVIKFAENSGRVRLKVVGTTMVDNTVKNPADLSQEMRKFKAEIYSLEHLHGPFDYVVAERFQSRGLRGNTIESINMMLGALSVMFPSFQLYTAAVWKNAFNRVSDLSVLYDHQKNYNKPIKKSDRRTIHELDCTLMGIYHAYILCDSTPFGNMEQKHSLERFFRHFEESAFL